MLNLLRGLVAHGGLVSKEAVLRQSWSHRATDAAGGKKDVSILHRRTFTHLFTNQNAGVSLAVAPSSCHNYTSAQNLLLQKKISLGDVPCFDVCRKTESVI